MNSEIDKNLLNTLHAELSMASGLLLLYVHDFLFWNLQGKGVYSEEPRAIFHVQTFDNKAYFIKDSTPDLKNQLAIVSLMIAEATPVYIINGNICNINLSHTKTYFICTGLTIYNYEKH